MRFFKAPNFREVYFGVYLPSAPLVGNKGMHSTGIILQHVTLKLYSVIPY